MIQKPCNPRKSPSRLPLLVATALGALGLAGPTWATTTTGAMPWDSVLTTIETDLTGPVVVAIAVIAVVLCGIGIAMGHEGSPMRKGFSILFGLSIAFMGASAILTFFGSSAGAVF